MLGVSFPVHAGASFPYSSALKLSTSSMSLSVTVCVVDKNGYFAATHKLVKFSGPQWVPCGK